MKALTTLAVGLGVLWLVGVTVIAVWPVVADAPWENTNGESGTMLRCEDALTRRLAAEEALSKPRTRGGGVEYPLTENAPSEAQRLQDIIAAAEQDIATFCH